MIHLWKDKGQTWSCFAWPSVLRVFPEVILPGVTKCRDLQKLPAFYAEILRAYTQVNRLNVSGEAGQQKNIWASELYPGISQAMIEAGFVEVADILVLNGVLDHHEVQRCIQLSGSAKNVFLLCVALQCLF